jgi:starvation-inducible DNA-binding protein
MQPTRNTSLETIRSQSIALLNMRLAAPIDLHAQVKQTHWSLRGLNLIAIHALFDKVAGATQSYSDLIVERAGGQ